MQNALSWALEAKEDNRRSPEKPNRSNGTFIWKMNQRLKNIFQKLPQ